MRKDRWVLMMIVITGLIVITFNTLLVNNVSGQWFEGSDASSLYLRARLFSEAPDSIFFMDNRYVGYTVFQFLAAFPYIRNEMAASFLIRFSNWLVWILSLIFFTGRIHKYFEIELTRSIPFILIVNSAMLWVSLYNFRDALIVSICISMLTAPISFNKRDLGVLGALSFFLWFLRYFFLYALAFSLLIALLILHLTTYSKGMIFRRISVVALFAIVIAAILPTRQLSVLSADLSQYLRFFVTASSNSVIESFRGLVSSFFAGNPLKFAYSAVGLGAQRAFVITSVSATFQWFVYLGTYFFLIPLYIILVQSSTEKLGINEYLSSESGESRNSGGVFFVASFVFITLVILIYSLFYGGTQERIRVVVLVPASVLFEVLRRKSTDHVYSSRALALSFMLMLLFVIFNPL